MYEYIIDTIQVVSRSYRYVPAVEPGEVIARRAAEGWRFCQIFPSSHAEDAPLQVVFERPARGPQDAVRADGPAPQWPRS